MNESNEYLLWAIKIWGLLIEIAPNILSYHLLPPEALYQ